VTAPEESNIAVIALENFPIKEEDGKKVPANNLDKKRVKEKLKTALEEHYDCDATSISDFYIASENPIFMRAKVSLADGGEQFQEMIVEMTETWVY
jgi:hypothetical protein